MRTYDAAVRTHRVTRGEHCLANHGDLERIGRAVGQQVRIWRSKDRLALYTVEQPPLDERGTIGMGRAGKKRLRGSEEFNVTVDAEVVDQRRTDEEAAADGEFVERLTVGRRRKLAVIAPHGGDIEAHTDAQAFLVRDRLRAVAPWVWVCKGWSLEDDAFARWHITSTDISPESFPLLKRMISRPFTHAISFHGFDRRRFPGADVRIGGLADKALKASVRDAIEDQVRGQGKPWGVVVDNEGDPFSGTDPENIVNRLAPASGGMQIEQSLRARRFMAAEIAHAVASVYE